LIRVSSFSRGFAGARNSAEVQAQEEAYRKKGNVGMQEAKDFKSFAFLNLKGEPRGNFMLQKLCEAGFIPAISIEENSKLAEKGRAALLGVLEEVKDRYPLPMEMPDMAEKYNFEVKNVKNHNNDDSIKLIKESGADVIILGDCRIMKKNIIDLVPGGVVNVHPGYLPDVRGNNVYLYALLNRLPQGTTCHYINSGVDTGPIIHKERLLLDWKQGMSYPELRVHINEHCGKVIVEAITRIKNGTVKLEPQPAGNPEDTWTTITSELKAEAISLLERGAVDCNSIVAPSDQQKA